VALTMRLNGRERDSLLEVGPWPRAQTPRSAGRYRMPRRSSTKPGSNGSARTVLGARSV
jgi:hypothetical protein